MFEATSASRGGGSARTSDEVGQERSTTDTTDEGRLNMETGCAIAGVAERWNVCCLM